MVRQRVATRQAAGYLDSYAPDDMVRRLTLIKLGNT